jgi:hypothetical protein
MKNALIALLLAAPSVVGAQSVEILPGRRMRVETARTSVTGALSSQTADSVILIGKRSARVAIANAEITRLRLSDGKSHGLGALKGLGYGAAIVGGGLALIVAGNGFPEEAIFFGAVGGFTGAFYGGIIGAIVGAEQWSAAQPARPRVSIGTGPSGATRLGLSFSF